MKMFDTYSREYENLRMTRTNGVLEVALHTKGKSLIFDGHTHEALVGAFHDIGSDPDNEVVILTGTGDAFMAEIQPNGFDFFSPRGYDKIYREGRKVLMNLLDIEVPIICAVNGPCLLHSEYVLLCDIVLASRTAVFQDMPHFGFGIVPGDGMHLLWPEVIGSVRGRYFLWTQQRIEAEEALRLGVVNEVHANEKLLARARELAQQLLKLPPLTRRYTRIATTQRLRRLIDEGTGYGLALEGISAADVAHSASSK